MAKSSHYARGFREGLSWHLPGESFIESLDMDTFPMDTEEDREAIREHQRGMKDGRAARAKALKKAGVKDDV